jgi:hypothetical protein
MISSGIIVHVAITARRDLVRAKARANNGRHPALRPCKGILLLVRYAVEKWTILPKTTSDLLFIAIPC